MVEQKIQLSLEDIKELIIAVPPRNEELQISEYIDEKLTQYEHLICQAEKLIGTYKSAELHSSQPQLPARLMFATGKHQALLRHTRS